MMISLLRIWYSDSDGSLHEGSVKAGGEILVQDFTITHAQGKVTPARSRLIRHGPDFFTNEISLPKDGGWAKFAAVRYQRTK